MNAHETHTPTPWYIYRDEDGDPISLAFWAKGPNGGSLGVSIARFSIDSKYVSAETRRANADFVLEAVNSHAALAARVAELEADKQDLIDALQPLLGCADYAREQDLSGHETLIVTASEAYEAASTMTRIEARTTSSNVEAVSHG